MGLNFASMDNRIQKMQALAREQGVDAIVLNPGASLTWATGQ